MNTEKHAIYKMPIIHNVNFTYIKRIENLLENAILQRIYKFSQYQNINNQNFNNTDKFLFDVTENDYIHPIFFK